MNDNSAGHQAATTLRQLAQHPEATPETREYLEGQAQFCEAHNVTPNDTAKTFNLWGFGEVTPEFVGATQWWATLADLTKPTGLTFDELCVIWHHMHAADWAAIEQQVLEGEDADQAPDAADSYTFERQPDGSPLMVMPMLSTLGTVRVFLTASPWRDEFLAATGPAWGHLFTADGVTDVEGGQTLADLTRDLPSREVAAHQAFQGPFADLDNPNPKEVA